MEWADIAIRLGAAVVIGGAIGIDRNLHHKPSGLRTLALVALAAAALVIAMAPAHDDVSRVIQGVVSGVGFIGAGVIIHRPSGEKVEGLTTAAAIWVTAALGMLCGYAQWRIVVVATVLIFVVLFFGGPLEKRCHKLIGHDKRDAETSVDDAD
ncbi:MAG: MgtC/SapB family protein [Proteobacteria bacterium]|nr:MgtC/SapB family protein [Pseudomonadota bacterium]